MTRILGKSARVALAAAAAATTALAAGGRTTATFLTLGVGGRAAAMGEAYTGLAEGVNAWAYNPGGVASLEAPEVTATHAEWLLDTRYEYVALAYPTSWGTFGLDARALTMGSLELRTSPTTPPPEPEGTFGANAFAVDLGYAYPVFDTLGAGVNAKFLRQKIYDTAATGFAGDAGLYWAPWPSFSAGLAARNLGPEITFVEEASPLPMTGELGLAYRLWDRQLVLAAAGEQPFDGDPLYKGGVEYNPFRFLSGRVGYIYGLDTGGNTGITGGVGVNVGGFSFDLAVAPYGDLGMTYRAGFTYVLGRERRRITAEVAAEMREEFERQKKQMIAALSAKAERYYEAGNFQEAVETWDLILVWDPENAEAARRHEEAQERSNEQLVAEHTGRAEAFEAEGKYSEAALEYSLALGVDPTHTGALAGLSRAEEGLAREEARQREEIAKLLEQARAAYSRGEYLNAVTKWEAVLELEPASAEAAANLEDARARLEAMADKYRTSARRYETAGNWGSALASWNRVLRLAPGDEEAAAGRRKALAAVSREAEALVTSGVALYERGDLDGAEKKFAAALDLQPDHTRANAYLGKIKERRAAQRKAMDYTKVYLNGIQAYTNHQYRAAIAYWEQIPSADPLYSKARTNIRRAKAVLKDLESK
ncbi:MAG: PorV/PorQ family protein [Candidatus Coatesbacteria bacterium]|nr:MAG: PorV/PorQ family protein [Candidatus Coatesbacteria bacterium]